MKNSTPRSVYEGMPIGLWPDFEVRWDLETKSYHLAFDGLDERAFQKQYPNGLKLLPDVALERLDAFLSALHRQRPENFWIVGEMDKKLSVLNSWLSGKAMTPPLVGLHEADWSLVIAGGHHRLAVARAKGVKRLPLLAFAEQYDSIKRKLNAE